MATISFARIARSRPALAGVSTISKIMARAGTFLIIAPIIGPTNQGIIVVTSAWSAVIALVVAYGFQVRVLREMAANPDRSKTIAKSDLSAMATLVIPALLIALVAAASVIPAHEHAVFTLILFGFIFSVVGDYCSSALRALDDFGNEASVSVISAIAQMILTVGAALLFNSILILAATLLVARAMYMALSMAVLFRNKTLSSSSQEDITAVTTTIKNTFPFFIDGSLSVLLSQIDIILLNWMVDRHTIGIYSAGSRLVQLILVVPWVATNIIVPGIARAANDLQAFSLQVKRLRGALIAVTVVGVTGLLVAGPIFTNYVLGPPYSPLNALWPMLGVMVIARFYESYFGIVMTGLGLMKRRVLVQGCAVIIISAGAYALVPAFNVLGLILVISVTSLATGLYYALSLSRLGRIDFYSAALTGTLLTLGATAVAVASFYL